VRERVVEISRVTTCESSPLRQHFLTFICDVYISTPNGQFLERKVVSRYSFRGARGEGRLDSRLRGNDESAEGAAGDVRCGNLTKTHEIPGLLTAVTDRVQRVALPWFASGGHPANAVEAYSLDEFLKQNDASS
jgi:hypothetical protein